MQVILKKKSGGQEQLALTPWFPDRSLLLCRCSRDKQGGFQAVGQTIWLQKIGIYSDFVGYECDL